MATVIDRLVIELGLDPKGFSKGQKQAAQGLLDTEKKAKSAVNAISQLRTQVLGLFAAFTAGRGLKEFIEDTTRVNAETGRLSKTLGTNTETLSAWRGIATLVGGTAAGMTGSIQNLVSQFQQFALTGESSVIPYFRALGVNIAGADGKMRATGSILLDLAEKFQGMDPARAAAFGKAMGFDEGTINLLIQGRAAVQAMLEDQKRLGVITKEDAAAAQALQKAWGQLDQASTSLGRTLQTAFAPIMTKVLNILTDLAVWARAHQPLVDAIFTGLAVGAVALAAVIAAPLAPIALLVAAVTGLVAAFSLLYDDWVVWTEGGKSLFGDFWAFVTALFTGSSEEIGKAWDNLFNGLGDRFNQFIEWVKNLGPVLLDAVKSMMGAASDWISDRLFAWTGGKLGSKSGSSSTSTSGSSSSSRAAATPSGSTEGDVAKLMGMGWTREQATGIAANIQRESSGNHQAVGDNGKAYGLAQWHPDRQANFRKWAGKDIRDSSRDEQLQFINYEMREGSEKKAGAALMAAKNASDAARIVSEKYERPSDRAGESSLRASLATAMMRPDSVPDGLTGASGAAMASNVANDNRSVSTSSAETKIGSITINTQATDADGIARDLGGAIEQNTFAQQANYGGV